MKMETVVAAPFSGTIDYIFVKEGQSVKTGELLVKLK
jgi:pyruvate carboxylase